MLLQKTLVLFLAACVAPSSSLPSTALLIKVAGDEVRYLTEAKEAALPGGSTVSREGPIELRTGNKSSAVVIFPDTSVLSVGANSEASTGLFTTFSFDRDGRRLPGGEAALKLRAGMYRFKNACHEQCVGNYRITVGSDYLVALREGDLLVASLPAMREIICVSCPKNGNSILINGNDKHPYSLRSGEALVISGTTISKENVTSATLGAFEEAGVTTR